MIRSDGAVGGRLEIRPGGEAQTSHIIDGLGSREGNGLRNREVCRGDVAELSLDEQVVDPGALGEGIGQEGMGRER